MAKKKDFTEAISELITRINKGRLKKKNKSYTRTNVKASTPNKADPKNLKKTKTYTRPKPTPDTQTQTQKIKVPKSRRATSRLGRIRDRVTSYTKTKTKQVKKAINKAATKTNQYVKTKRALSRVRPDPTAKNQVGFDKTKPNTAPSRTARVTKALKNSKVLKDGVTAVKGGSKWLNRLKIGGKTLGGIGAVVDLANSTAGAIKTGGNIINRVRGKEMQTDFLGAGKGSKASEALIKSKNRYLRHHGSLKGWGELMRKFKANKSTKKDVDDYYNEKTIANKTKDVKLKTPKDKTAQTNNDKIKITNKEDKKNNSVVETPKEKTQSKEKTKEKPKKWGDSAAGKTAEKAFMEKAKAGKNLAVNAGMDPKKLWEQRKRHRQFLVDNNRKIPKSLR